VQSAVLRSHVVCLPIWSRVLALLELLGTALDNLQVCVVLSLFYAVVMEKMDKKLKSGWVRGWEVNL